MKIHRFMTLLIVYICLLLGIRAEEIKCPDIKDVWLSGANREESDTNGGKAPRIKLKFYQEFGLLDFDVSKLKGKKIDSAALFVAPDGGAVFGKARGSDLRWFSVSTVSADWVEGLGESYSKDEQGHGATFNESSYKTLPWTVPGSKCWDVILGNGNSLRCDVDAGDPHDGWFKIPLDKRLVEALIAGASHGLMVMDGSTGVERNSTISSREGKRAPYLMVTVSGDDATVCAAPTNLKITPAPNEATVTHGAVEVSLTVPEKAFAYQIKMNGHSLLRWQIPFAAKAGATQTFFLCYLTPDSDVKLEVAAVDAVGNESAFVSAIGKCSPAIVVPLVKEEQRFKGPGGSWHFVRVANNRISFSAARGEILSFPVWVKKHAKNIQIEIEGLGDVNHKVWRCWHVKYKDKWVSEYAIPVSEKLPLNSPDTDDKSDLNNEIQIDLIIPHNSAPGNRKGKLVVKSDDVTEAIPVNLTVHSAVIPDEIHFNPELNAYDEPGGAGSEMFFDSHRIAHYNRCSINSVPYSQRGDMHAGVAPKVGADGHVTDWSAYDKNNGPLLDGSAFKYNPRAGVPVAAYYLPFNENYPLPMKPNYKPGCALEGKDWKPKHDMLAKPPEQAFSKEYQDAFVNCVGDFATHFDEKKYDRTLVEGFFNNKWSFGPTQVSGTAWLMDEPSTLLDWKALLFFSKMFHAGLKNQQSSHFIFRGDISRPMWQGNCFDGYMELMNANNEQFQMPDLMRDRKRNMPTILYTYGAANDLDRSNLETVAWCVKAYCHGCDGVVPWQSLGNDKAFDEGDAPGNGNALIVDGRKRFGINAIASFRVHAFRDGAQLCELLRLLEIKKGWSRAHSGAFVSQLIPLGAEFKQGFADDAAGLKFGNLNAESFVQLKEAILKMLDE